MKTNMPPRTRVAVLVDLLRTPDAGGHVKSWERFAEAAVRHPQRIDLTVHCLGERTAVIPLAEHVRFHHHRPRFSTARLRFLSHIPDHTDLATCHPGLARHLVGADVIHTTDAFFAFAGTALRVARRHAIPLVNSVHTDTPSYTRVYTAQTIERLLGRGLAARLLIERLCVPLRAERRMLLKLARHQRHSAFVLVASATDREKLRRTLPGACVGLLRRGVDKQFFTAAKRDRTWLQQRMGVPPERLAVLFVGRLSRGKNVLVVAEAVARLAREGRAVSLICAGRGDLRRDILAMLGEHARCPGVVLGEDLARLYASVDLFAMPSEIEIFSNVIQEAMASGLSTIMAHRGGSGWQSAPEEAACVVPEGSVEAWTRAIGALLADPPRRAAMALAARGYAETCLPSWDEVLAEDLLPVWQAAAALKADAANPGRR